MSCAQRAACSGMSRLCGVNRKGKDQDQVPVVAWLFGVENQARLSCLVRLAAPERGEAAHMLAAQRMQMLTESLSAMCTHRASIHRPNKGPSTARGVTQRHSCHVHLQASMLV